MKKYILLIGLTGLLSGMTMANEGVEIKKAERVNINLGMSQKQKLKMVKCMLCLKKHKTPEEALDEKLPKIEEKCEKYKLSQKKCQKIKKHVAMSIYQCFTMRDFFQEFFKGADNKTAKE